jgi:hypothetical protein
MAPLAFSPHLSVVAASRNDDHGGHLRKRMQLFVDGLAAQASRHALPLELVLVEWNPPTDRPPLREALRWPAPGEFFDVRLVSVPASIHARLDPGGALPLFQMIAKNAGIRRARGRFVLATNVDVLFPDELFLTLRDGLREGVLYRNDRLDVSRDIPEGAPLEELLRFCRAHVLRAHRADGTFVKEANGRWVKHEPELPDARSAIRRWVSQLLGRVGSRRRLGRLHINGGGDFTLLDRQAWWRLRGYPEWVVFSWHLDSVFLFQVDANRIPFRTLPREQCTYHVDHGGGWTPEDQDSLFSRLSERGIRVLTDRDLLRLRIEMGEKRRRGERVVYNGEGWGLADENLPEQCPV